MAGNPSPVAMTIARWWASWLRDTRWLAEENASRRRSAEKQIAAAELTEKRIRTFEVQLAEVIEQYDLNGHTHMLLEAFNSPPSAINSAARYAGFEAWVMMFPRGSYTRYQSGCIVAGTAKRPAAIIPLIYFW